MKIFYTFLNDRDVNDIKTKCKNVNVTYLCDEQDETCSAVVNGKCHCFDCHHTSNGKHKIKKAMRFFEILYFPDKIELFEGDIGRLNFVRANKESLEAQKDDIVYVAAKFEDALKALKTYDHDEDTTAFEKIFEERILHRGRYKWGGNKK